MRRACCCATAALLVLALSGCSSDSDDLRAARDTWERGEPDAYSFTYRVGGMAGRVRLAVRVINGEVMDSKPLGEPAYPVDPLTVDGVFDVLAEVQDDADEVDVEYDTTWGFPSAVSVDEDTDAIDDEFGFGIEDFRVTAP